MKQTIIALPYTLPGSIALAQTPAAAIAPVAAGISEQETRAFIDVLPRDRVGDKPICVVESSGNIRLGMFAVYRSESGEVA